MDICPECGAEDGHEYNCSEDPLNHDDEMDDDEDTDGSGW